MIQSRPVLFKEKCCPFFGQGYVALNRYVIILVGIRKFHYPVVGSPFVHELGVVAETDWVWLDILRIGWPTATSGSGQKKVEIEREAGPDHATL